jgi:hypothetical protein
VAAAIGIGLYVLLVGASASVVRADREFTWRVLKYRGSPRPFKENKPGLPNACGQSRQWLLEILLWLT